MDYIKRVYVFYRDGFREMTIGRTLWAIILIKLFIMFFIIRIFFSPNFLNTKGETNEDKADYVRNELIKRK
ncbi:MAG: DUF4492 domain-containing protein [Bacteroidales bacterium]|nr:DUF4492 domain-containing protein [Bacteroidales bacterium]